MFVFWFLVVGAILLFGIGVAYLFGEGIYKKAESVSKAFTEIESNSEKEKEINE